MQLHDDELDQQLPNQKALLQQLGGTAQGGTTGFAPSMPLDPPLAPQAPAAPPSYDGLSGNYDRGKLNDPNKQSAKYLMGRTLAGFDARQGITPEVLAAINGLGFGSFSGSGDKLALSGLTDKGREHGLVGDYQGADFIEGLKSGNGKWGYQDPAEEARLAQGQQRGGGGGGQAMGGLNSMLTSDPMMGIQAMVGKYSQQGDNLKALLAQLGGGGNGL
jgi:hypothetical protein